MHANAHFVSALLVCCLAACGGKSFEVDPNQGGSDQGGSTNKAGTDQGGSTNKAGTGQGGSVQAGTGQGGGAGSSCEAFDDQPGAFIAVEIHNRTSAAIHLGQDMVDCGISPLFAVQDASGAPLPTPGGCRSSCQTVRQQGPIGCPAICAYPSSLTLQPGEVMYTSWDGLFTVEHELPEQCLVEPDYGNSCLQARVIQPGSFTFTAQAGASLDCSPGPSGMCQSCMPTGSGGCNTPASLISGTRLKAATTVLLNGSYGVYGYLPPPAPAYPGDPAPDAEGAAPGPAVALQAVQLVFTE